MNFRVLLVVLVVATPSPGQPIDFAEAAKREVGAFGQHAVGGGDAGFTATVEASAAPTVKPLENAHHLIVPVGRAGTLHCFALPPDLDQSELVGRARKGVQKGEIQRAQLMDVLAVGVNPLLLIDYEYVLNGGHGLVKAATWSSRAGSFICLHDAVGYTRAFRRWTTQLARTLTVEREDGPPAEPVRASLERASVVGPGKELPLGYELRRRYEREEGGFVDERLSLAVIQSTAAEFSVYESARVITSDAKNAVLEGLLISTGGPREVEVTWTPVPRKKNEYQVKGTAGDPVDLSLKSPAPLATDAVIEAAALAIVQGKSKAWRGYLYQPDSDLSAVVPVALKPTERERRVVMTVGPQQLIAEVDGQGAFSRIEIQQGQLTIVQQRVATLEAPGKGFVDDAPLAPEPEPTPVAASPTRVSSPEALAALVREDNALSRDVQNLRGRQGAATGLLWGGLGLGAATVAAGVLLVPPECRFEGPSGAQSCGIGLTHGAVIAGGVALAVTGAIINWALNPKRPEWERIIRDWNDQTPAQPAELSSEF